MQPQILVPLDGSPMAEIALPHAVAMAKLTSSTLTLLRAVPPPTVFEPIAGTIAPSAAIWEIWDGELDMAREYVATIARSLQPEGLSMQTAVFDEQPATAIVRYCEEQPSVALVVMATHGRSGLRRWVFGSVAEKVLHASPRPLLLIRPTGKESEKPIDKLQETPAPHYRKIVVPLDGSPFAEQALEQARKIACRSGGKLILVSVATTPIDYRIELAGAAAGPVWVESVEQPETEYLTKYVLNTAEKLQMAGLEATGHITEGMPEEEILRVSQRVDADLIVMSTHGRSGLERMWLGSVAMKVVQTANTPVLLVRAHEH